MTRTIFSPSRDFFFQHSSAPICIGHRGARAFAPENTLESISKSAKLGCKMVEIDVHMSADKYLIVHHDDTLDRCTNALSKLQDRSYFISELTLNEIKSLDAGSWYWNQLARHKEERQGFLASMTQAEEKSYISDDDLEKYKSGIVKVPTLDEALFLCKKLNIMVNIEIKSIPRMYDGISKKVLSLVEELNLIESVLISSFDHCQLTEIRTLSKKVATAVLSSDRIALPERYLEMLDADSYNPGCYSEYDTVGFGSLGANVKHDYFNKIIENKKMVLAWTCNSAEQIKSLVESKFNGVMTDYPNRFFDVIF